MENKLSENPRIFTRAALTWLFYLLLQLLIDTIIYYGRPARPLYFYYTVNFIPALLFLGLSFTKWVRRQSRAATIIMILIISLIPIFLPPLFQLQLPQAPLSNIEGRALRQLPVLMIGLVLVAWHYPVSVVVIYPVVLNILEIIIMKTTSPLGALKLNAFVFTTIIRTICFLVVGVFINQLLSLMRSQQEALSTANQKLSNYAATMEELTISRERNRVSRELHDTVVHSLSGLAVQLETIKAYLERDKKIAGRLIDQALQSTRNGLSETRRALKALRASPLEDLGLIEAVRSLTQSAAQRGSLKLKLTLPKKELFLPPNVEQSVYRIIQESVENILHHANAHQLTVSLQVKDKDLEILIQDDGAGFDSSKAVPEGHYGLAGMQERAQMAGGELDLISRPSQGTSIKCVFKGSVA